MLRPGFFGSFGRVAKGARAISQSLRADAAAVHLLFDHGKRPDRDAIAAFAAREPAVTLSHDPRSADAGQQAWVELLREGLTFDLAGLAPGPAASFPDIAHRFDLTAFPEASAFDALSLSPGPHLAAGAKSMPVIRGMLALACDLVRQFDDLAAVCWGPSRSAIGRRYFESVTSAWLDGGPFPALGLIAFVEGSEGTLDSLGLAFWIGQELRIAPPLSVDRVASTRLGVRLVNQLVLTGGVAREDRIVAPDGSPLVLRASPDGALIHVQRE